MKLLLLGANGQVGWELQRSLAPLGDLQMLDRSQVDLTQPASLLEAVDRAAPDVIINAAAYTAVDKAESETAQAHATNAEAPATLAEAARRLGALLVHYSTDYVFDGSGLAPWTEDARTGPLNVYGHTKLEGELAIRASGARHLIFRTSWVYAARGNNFARTMLRLAQERENLTIVDDQWGAPTGADLIADVTAHAILSAQRKSDTEGTYHLAASGETNWHQYANLVLSTAQRLQPDLHLKTSVAQPVSGSAYQTAARRPNNSRLDTTHLRQTFGLHLPAWQQGVRRMLSEILRA